MSAETTWPSYLSRGGPAVIYHMCESTALDKVIKSGSVYFPPTYASDGFVHACAFPNDLIGIANNFYKSSVGDWVCISLNPALLGGEVKYELAAPVGDKQTADTSGLPKFPHIYGGIPPKAIIHIYEIKRNESGDFLHINGLR
jgi:uncharacterized protein (DUF952 family)